MKQIIKFAGHNKSNHYLKLVTERQCHTIHQGRMYCSTDETNRLMMPPLSLNPHFFTTNTNWCFKIAHSQGHDS